MATRFSPRRGRTRAEQMKEEAYSDTENSENVAKKKGK